MKECRINWSDVTFTSMVRLDSEDRLENLNVALNFLRFHFPSAKILICEEDGVQKLPSLALLEENEYFFVQNEPGKYHHRTRNMNLLAERATSRILVSYDIDAIIPPTQLAQAINEVREARCDVCNPFTILRHLDQRERERFKGSLDVDGIAEYRSYTASWRNLVDKFDDVVDLAPFKEELPEEATGLVIVHDRRKYFEFGGANENLLGHASEEVERFMRFIRLGATWNRIEGPGYHMTHSRVQNDLIRNDHYEGNMREISKTIRSNRSELSEIVSKWLIDRQNDPLRKRIH